MRRKAGQVQATSELAEDSSNMQPRCDAEAAPSEITALDVEDGEATLPDPSQSCVSARIYFGKPPTIAILTF